MITRRICLLSKVVKHVRLHRTSDSCKLCEEKVYLWTNDITFLAHLFIGRHMLIFSKKVLPSLTISIFMTQIHHWLRWLSCFPRLHNKQSLVSTLTSLIYMKIYFYHWLHWLPHIKDKIHHWIRWLRWLTSNSYITNYADYADIQYYTKNNPITDYANYADFEYQE